MRRFVEPLSISVVLALTACGGGGGGGGGSTGSRHLWVTDSREAEGVSSLSGISFEQLVDPINIDRGYVKKPDAVISMDNVGGLSGVAMGPDGSLWVAGRSTLARFDAGELLWTGEPTPASFQRIPGEAGEVPLLHFDPRGNLWESYGSRAGGGMNEVYRYKAADFTASNEGKRVDRDLTLRLPTMGCGRVVLHDRDSHLWVVDQGNGQTGEGSVAPRFMRAPDSVLTATGTQTFSPAASFGTAGQIRVGGVAFDSAGALWAFVDRNGTGSALVRYGRSQLPSSGATSDLTPEALITISSVTPTAGSIAFDADGNLWLLSSSPIEWTLQRLPASELAGTGERTADITFTLHAVEAESELGIVFDPTPAGLPIQY